MLGCWINLNEKICTEHKGQEPHILRIKWRFFYTLPPHSLHIKSTKTSKLFSYWVFCRWHDLIFTCWGCNWGWRWNKSHDRSYGNWNWLRSSTRKIKEKEFFGHLMEKVSPKIRQNFWKLNTSLGHPQDSFSRRREEPGVIFLLFRLSWGPFALRVMKCPQLSHLFITPVSIPVPTIRHSSSSFLPWSPPSSIPIPVLFTTLRHLFPSLLPTLLRLSPLSLLQNSPIIGL